jgi:hypothetical protein
MSEVEVYPAPFLQRYQIYRVEYFNPTKPVLFYVGFAPGQPAYLLTGAPENYVRLAQADGLVITSTQVAVAYATTYLEVTRSMAELFYLVQSVQQVEFRPNLIDPELQVKTAFIDKYRSLLKPATAEVTASGYTVTVYAIREQALERHTLTVTKQGDLRDEVTILEQNLPLVYGL